MVEAEQTDYRLDVDAEKAMAYGIAPAQVVGNLTYVLREMPVSQYYDPTSVHPVGIVLKLKDQDKSSLEDLKNLKIQGNQGPVAMGDLVSITEGTLQKTIYRKDQKRVVYVLADMAGTLESPVYAILGMNEKLQAMSF